MKRRRHQPSAPKATKTAVVEIEKPIYGGAFLARLEGKATFVPLTLPGEQARIRIVEDKRSYATAETEEIVAASADRVEPRCPHFGVCGGCSYQHANYESQLGLKQQILRETLQRAGVEAPKEIEVLAGEPWAYRNRIRVAFDASGRVGYRGRRSHDIVAIKECPIAAPLLVTAALEAADILRRLKGTIRPTEMSLFCDAEERALLASIYVNGPAAKGFDEFASAWKEMVPELAGAECVEERSADGDSKQLARWGAESTVYRTGGFEYRVDHGSFFQVNRWLMDRLVQRVIGDRRGALAWDLYAGVGLFARQLAGRFKEVMAVESAPAAKLALGQNLLGTNGRGVTTDTFSFLIAQDGPAKPDLIVVDPPRAGLGPDISGLLGKIEAPALVYVSCDPSTLARDLKVLIASGYAIGSVALADLFPQTFHLETVVTLHKS